MKDIKRWLPGAVISLILVAVILHFVDFHTVAEAVRRANYYILGIAMVLSFLWMALRAAVWWTLLRERAPYKDVFFTISEGYLLNNFLPFRLGELGRAFLLSRKSSLTFMEILPTIVIERAVDLVYSALVLLAAIPFVVGAQDSAQIGIVIAVVVLAGIAALYLLARNRQWALALFHKLSARWPVIQRFGGEFLEAFFSGLAVITDGWVFVRFLFWMTLDWIVAIVSYFLIIRAFFPQAEWTWALFGLGAAAFGGAIPSLPGAVGTFEGAFGGALTLLSGDQSTSLAVALTARLYNYLNSGVLGFIGLAREGQTLSGIYQQLMNFRTKKEKGSEGG